MLATWLPATEGPASISDGLEALDSAPAGVPHVFAWDPFADLPADMEQPLRELLKTPQDERSDEQQVLAKQYEAKLIISDKELTGILKLPEPFPGRTDPANKPAPGVIIIEVKLEYIPLTTQGHIGII